MTLVDTGPFVALFDPQDAEHARCKALLEGIRGALLTTTPVLTEAFHLLTPNSIGADRLRDFIVGRGVTLWFMDESAVGRAFELMEHYRDQAMDFADASLIVAAEVLRTSKIFTLDQRDFRTYRIRRGHRYMKVEMIG